MKCWTCGGDHDPDDACVQRRTSIPPSSTIPAKFSGWCSAGDWIAEGQMIRSDGDGGWIHVECKDVL